MASDWITQRLLSMSEGVPAQIGDRLVERTFSLGGAAGLWRVDGGPELTLKQAIVEVRPRYE